MFRINVTFQTTTFSPTTFMTLNIERIFIIQLNNNTISSPNFGAKSHNLSTKTSLKEKLQCLMRVAHN